MARADDPRVVLPRIELPTLVLHGSAVDQCPFAHGRCLAEGTPAAQLEIWAGGAHVLMAKAPDRFAQAVLRLCAAARADMLDTTR